MSLTTIDGNHFVYYEDAFYTLNYFLKIFPNHKNLEITNKYQKDLLYQINNKNIKFICGIPMISDVEIEMIDTEDLELSLEITPPVSVLGSEFENIESSDSVKDLNTESSKLEDLNTEVSKYDSLNTEVSKYDSLNTETSKYDTEVSKYDKLEEAIRKIFHCSSNF